MFCTALFFCPFFVSDSQMNTGKIVYAYYYYFVFTFHLSHSVQALLLWNDQLYTTAAVTAMLLQDHSDD